jgi:hypothetical protein
LREGLLREGLLREGLLREGLLREGLLREGLLREGLLREGLLSTEGTRWRQRRRRRIGGGLAASAKGFLQWTTLPVALLSVPLDIAVELVLPCVLFFGRMC